MAESVKIQGWCPTAWKPMQAQDGWIVRVRPHCASVSAQQWCTLAELAQNHAHPHIELTRLGNIQLRGVSEENLDPLRAQLIAARLIPADADADLTPAVHCSPFYQPHDSAHRLAQALSAAASTRLSPRALQSLGIAALPSKFSLLVDDTARRLGCSSADLRLWVNSQGGYSLALGDAAQVYDYTHTSEAVEAAVQVAIWFAQTRTHSADKPPTRLQQLLVHQRPELAALQGRASQMALSNAETSAPFVPPGRLGEHLLLGAPLGRIAATDMFKLAKSLPAQAEIRVTPWRSLLLQGGDAAMPIAQLDSTPWITHAADTRLGVSACTGSPRCTQAHIPAQEIALQLAPHVPAGAHLHVSGCPKLCALSKDATAILFASTAASSNQILLNATSAGLPAHPVIQIPYQAGAPAPAEIPKRLHELSI